jgi:hypothetical protein
MDERARHTCLPVARCHCGEGSVIHPPAVAEADGAVHHDRRSRQGRGCRHPRIPHRREGQADGAGDLRRRGLVQRGKRRTLDRFALALPGWADGRIRHQHGTLLTLR